METYLVLWTALLSCQRNYITTSKIFHQTFWIGMLENMKLESTWKSVLNATSCYIDHGKSLFTVPNVWGPVINPLLVFCQEKGVILSDVFLLRQYTTRCCFEPLVQNVVDALREWDQSKKKFSWRDYENDWKLFIWLSDNGPQSKYENRICEGSNVDKLINKIIFMSVNELSTFSVIQTNMSWLKWIMIEFTLAPSKEKLDKLIRLEMRLLW